MTRAMVLATMIIAGVSACILESPRYDGTTFSCEASAGDCPTGYSCVDEVCRPDDPASDPAATTDAGSAPEPNTADAAVPPDAGAAVPPDAMSRPLMTVTLSGTNITDDTYLAYNSQRDNYGDRDYVSIDADPLRAGLLRFELSSIPAGAQVESAHMTLYFYDPIEDGEFRVYQMLESWDEKQATWEERRSGIPWTAPGAGTGSYVATPMFSIAPRESKAYMVALPVATVQTWVSAPVVNYGMKWDSTSATGRGGEFDSSESTYDPPTAPTITIEYR